MTELVKSEITRFGKWIGLGVLLHFALLLMLVNFGIYLNAGQGLGALSSIVYGGAALLFGVVQMRSFCQGSLWAFLINRPAQTHQIAACLTAAGMVVLILVGVFPPILVVASMDWLTSSVVDLRHYLQSFFFLGLITSGYLAGCYVSLSPSKGSVLVLAMPILLVASMLQGNSVHWICLAILVWQSVLLASVFKPNLASHSPFWFYRFANIVAFQLASYFVVCLAAGIAVQGYLMLAHGAGVTTSWNDYFDHGVFDRMETEDSREKLFHSIDALEDERKTFLQQQIELCDVHQVLPIPGINSLRQQLPCAGQSQQLMLDDSYNKIKWQFSHNQMAFLRADVSRQSDSEQLAVYAREKRIELTRIPVVVDDQVVTPTAVYSYDADFKCLVLRFRTSDNEKVLSSIEKAGQRYLLLTTRALYFFESTVVANQSGMITPSAKIPLPRSQENLHSIDIAELLDSDLISFLWGTHSEGGLYPAEQTTFRIFVDGTAQLLSARKLRNGFPALYRHRGFYVSPLTHAFRTNIVAPNATAKSLNSAVRYGVPPMSKSLILTIALATALSVAITWWLSNGRIASRNSKWIWLAVVLFTSFAGLLSFVLLNPKRPPIAMLNPEASKP